MDQIKELYTLALITPDKEYYIAYSGSGKNLNAYSSQDMAKMFKYSMSVIPENIIFEEEFSKLL